MKTLAQIAGGEIENASRVTVRTCDLVCGRECRFDIRHVDGSVLIQGGTVLTEAVLDELDARGIGTVNLDYRDVRNVLCRDGGDAASKNRRSVVRHGVIPYDEQQKQRLAHAFQEAAAKIDTLRTRVLDGETVPCREFDELVESHFDEMTNDVDCTLACVLETVVDDALIAHALQLSVLGMTMGMDAELDSLQIHVLGLTGLVHDWGMLKLPEEIRHLDRPPTARERRAVQQHPKHTLELLGRVRELPESVPTVSLHLHERPDGSGYPEGLSGPEIHPLARILHVADTFLAQTSGAFGDAPLKPYSSVESLLQMAAAGRVDRDAIRNLLRAVSLFPIGSLVELSDRRVARVIRPNQNFYTEPIVLILSEERAENTEPEVIDLTESELRIIRALPRASEHRPTRRDAVQERQ